MVGRGRDNLQSRRIFVLVRINYKVTIFNVENYRPLSLLSVPSNILETIVADSIIHHAFIENKLITDKQWAYRRGYSTELLLVHMTEIWRSAIDSNEVVGIVLVDFQKAFDCVSHNVLLRKLENDFGLMECSLTGCAVTLTIENNILS